jgi:hypothetical protein
LRSCWCIDSSFLTPTLTLNAREAPQSTLLGNSRSAKELRGSAINDSSTREYVVLPPPFLAPRPTIPSTSTLTSLYKNANKHCLRDKEHEEKLCYHARTDPQATIKKPPCLAASTAEALDGALAGPAWGEATYQLPWAACQSLPF